MKLYMHPVSMTSRPVRLFMAEKGLKADWAAFADDWRGLYQPAMDEVRSGRIAFCKLDVLHRQNLERILPGLRLMRHQLGQARAMNDVERGNGIAIDEGDNLPAARRGGRSGVRPRRG